MTLVHALPLGLALLGGIGLGVVFFGGLWWTVRRGIYATAPALWFSVSWLLRSAAVLGGFYVLCSGEWQRSLACLLGFVLARWALLRLLGAPISPRQPQTFASPT